MQKEFGAKTNVNAITHKEFGNKPVLASDTVYIVDEFDLWYYGTANSVAVQVSGDGYMLCLSATGISRASAIERNFLRKLNAYCLQANWASSDLESDMLVANDLEDFLQQTQD